MKVLWIGGWGASPAWGLTCVRRWQPEWNHEWAIPAPGCSELADGSHDWVVGYSLGAFLMLLNLDDFPSRNGHSYLAPFLDLKREAGLGGMVSATQLKVTQKWLQREPLRALSDFYFRAGLNMPLQKELPYSLSDLQWGIEMLLGKSAPFPRNDPGRAVFGEKDALVDACASKRFFPCGTILPGKGHRLESLRAGLELS